MHALVLALLLGIISPQEIKTLVNELGSNDSENRDQAQKELAKLGFQAEDELKIGVKSKDLEVKLRCEQLLSKIAIDRLWTATNLNIEKNQITLTEACELISQEGYKIKSALETSDKRLVNLRKTTFFELMDDISKQCKADFKKEHFRQEGVNFEIFGRTNNVNVSYKGPVRVVITEALRSTLSMRDFLNNTTETKDVFTIDVMFLIEPKIKLLAYSSPTVQNIKTNLGEELREIAEQPSWNSGSVNTGRLKLMPPSHKTKSVDFDLKWTFLGYGESETLKITKPIIDKLYSQSDCHVIFKEINEIKDKNPNTTLVINLALNQDNPVLRQLVNVNNLEDFRFVFKNEKNEVIPSNSDSFVESEGLFKYYCRLPVLFNQIQSFELTCPKHINARELIFQFKGVELPEINKE